MAENLVQQARAIPRFKKERFLLTLSEDEFRDRVVRPLFLRLGYSDGRDLCGPNEEGKDTFFVAHTPLGLRDVYVVQTKKGGLNLASKASQNLIQATTQLTTALATRVILSPTKEKRLPAKAFLCASGKINDSARRYVAEQISDPRVEFLDANDLVPKIDEVYPELWFDIDPDLRPYLKALRTSLLDTADELLPGTRGLSAVSDEMFVDLHLHRPVLKTKKVAGKIERHPVSDELPTVGVPDRRERLILITGDGGSGKSTALRRLAVVMIDRSLRADSAQTQIPVLLKALSLADDGQLVHLAMDETRRIVGGTRASFSAEDLAAGRVTILVDALDELADDASRTTVLAKVEEFHSSHPRCQVVVTSREYAFIGILPALKRFVRFRIVPITHRQVEQILKRVQSQRQLPSHTAKEILRRIEQVHGLQLNPLLVTVFASTTDYARRDVPANITELFKKYTEMMLGRWDASKGLSQQFQAPLKDFVLCQVAFEMHRRRVTNLELAELRRLVRVELDMRGHEANADVLVEELLDRSGVFRTIGDRIEFRHLLLQEFFAGRGVTSSEFLESVITDPWWQRAVVFYFGQNPGDSKTLASLVASMKLRPASEQFHAAVAIGLGLQASYLIELRDKIDVLEWVVATLAASKAEFVDKAVADGVKPLTAFVWYYLFGRDATACSVPEHTRTDLTARLLTSTDENAKDTRKFWIVVSLLETGLVPEALEVVKRYRASDARHLLGIHLGAFLLEHLRIADGEQKSAARQIRARLEDSIVHLRQQLFEEVRSELLEVRDGTVKALPQPDGGSSGAR